MSYIDTELAQLNVWEGDIPWLYLDNATPPNATTGKGYLVANLNAMLALPWRNPDATPATSGQVLAEWNRVKAMPGGMVARAYECPASLTLAQADIDALTEKMLLQIDAWMPKLLPQYATFPDAAKVACLDMGWNLGEERLAAYHHFLAAGNATPPDFAGMAAECGRNVGQAAFVNRNNWTRALFQQAAEEVA